MKTLYSILFLFIIMIPSYSQKNRTTIKIPDKQKAESNKEQQLPELIYDCNTVFWSTNINGEIRQWNLINNQVTGGAIVQTGGGSSLAFCGYNNELTFFSTCCDQNEIKKFDNTTSSWITIPSSISLNNNGGYYEDQYFFALNNTIIYYFDGTNISVVPGSNLSSSLYKVADISVDTLGRAWVFTGSNDTSIDTIKIFNSSGLVTTYTFATPLTSTLGFYGSFFINDKIYISGNNNNVLIPININGSNASTGTSIPFPNNSYLDLASCNKTSPLHIFENDLNNQITVYPNPTKNNINIDINDEIISIFIYSIDGKLIKTIYNTKSIDISDLAKTTYLLKVISENNVYNKFIIKN